jgi:hypothetical protein
VPICQTMSARQDSNPAYLIMPVSKGPVQFIGKDCYLSNRGDLIELIQAYVLLEASFQ